MSDVATDEVEGDGMKKSNEDDTWEGTNGAAAGKFMMHCLFRVAIALYSCVRVAH